MTSLRWSLLLVLLICPRLAEATTFRLMLIGDSITEGQGAPPGFRDNLHALLNAEPGLTFDFVGSMGTPPLQGHFLGGQTVEDFYPPTFGYGWGNGSFDTTPDMGPPGTPNIVAIHIGTNDLNSQLPPYIPYSYDHGQTFIHSHCGELADYLRFLNQWRDGTRSTDLSRFVLSLNIPMQGRSQDVKDWNNGIIAMTEDFGEGTATGSPLKIAIADHYHRFLSNPDLFTFGPGDWMSDALHPNDAGYTEMADIYQQAILAAVNDSIAPSPIVDLTVVEVDTTRIRLTFTAVGDDSLLGRAARYDLRVSTDLINAQTFAYSPQAAGEKDPNTSWDPDTLDVSSLLPGTTYYFAVKVVDDAGNRSAMSNVRSATTIGAPIVVLTLRNDLSGYAGTDDSQMLDARPVENAGASTVFAVGKHGSEPFTTPEDLPGGEVFANPDGGSLVTDLSRSLVRFDLTGLPAGVNILDARLRCYCYERDSSTPTEIGAYRLVKHWVEGTRQTWGQQQGAACWSAAQLGVLPWSAPGAGAASDTAQNNDPNNDRFATPEDIAVVSAINTWYEWDLTTAVAQWVSGAWENEGILLKAVLESANSRRAFYSSENVLDQTLRPTLVVTYAAAASNSPPIAHAGGPYQGEEDIPIQFDGTASFDPEGQPLTYAWDFGDGETGTGPMPMHAYADPGTYTVTLVVHDGEVGSDPDQTEANVAQTTGVAGDPAAGPPLVTRLLGATPNPVARAGALRYDLATRAHVRLRVADVQGRIVRVLVDEATDPGEHRVEWNGADMSGRRLPAGIYFAQLEAAGVRESRKIILLP